MLGHFRPKIGIQDVFFRSNLWARYCVVAADHMLPASFSKLSNDYRVRLSAGWNHVKRVKFIN